MMIQSKIMYQDEKQTVIIIGGGAAGCASAEILADTGYQVILLEKTSDLLARTSNATPCRLGLGFHYMDEQTAIKYLRATVAFVRCHPGYLVGEKLSTDNPLRHGRYFITKDSQFVPSTVLKVYNRLKQEYTNLVASDPANQVFGPPQAFFRILERHEYKDVVNEDNVALAIETQEHVLNWPQYKQDFLQRLISNPNIKIITDSEVTDIKYDSKSLGYEVVVNNKVQGQVLVQHYQAQLVINAAWENIAYLNTKLGFPMPKDSRTIRLKTMIEVQLPAELEALNSMFFCFGPHCAFSNLGGGRGFLTYEPVTNVDSTTSLTVPKELERLASGQATDKEISHYAAQIIKGASNYIPGLASAKFKKISFGYVITSGANANIDSAESTIHARRESGVGEHSIGFVQNASMKLLYMEENAREIAVLMDKQVRAYKTLPTFYQELDKQQVNIEKADARMFFCHNFLADELINKAERSTLVDTAVNKKKLQAELLTFFKTSNPQKQVIKSEKKAPNVAFLPSIAIS